MMINVKRNWRAAFVALAAGASMIAITAAQAAEITVWSWDPNFNGATMKEAGDRYTATHPDVTFNLVDMAKADLETKLQTQLASGTTEGLPDIVLIEDYGAQKYLQSFPGSFAALSDQFDFSGFAPSKVAVATLDGKVYSMPFDSGVTGLFYRSDYLAEAGYSGDDLQDITWDQFIEIGKAVEAKTGHKMLSLDPADSSPLKIFLQSAGKWYFTEDGQIDIADSAVFKAALETYARLLQSGIYKPGVGWAEYTGAVTSGDVAGIFSGVWMTATIKSQPDQAGKWGVAPLPRLDIEGASHASNLGGSSWYVIESSAEKAEAIDFLTSVWGADVDFYQKILVDQGAVGSLLAAREGDAYKASDEFFGGEPVWQNFSTWLAEIPGVNYGIFTNEADAALSAQLPSLIEGGSVDDAIAAISSQVSQQIQ